MSCNYLVFFYMHYIILAVLKKTLDLGSAKYTNPNGEDTLGCPIK
jgi:hypothetical protein